MQSIDADLFWSKVDRSGGPDACWPWNGRPLHAGYGGFTVNGRGSPAHRVAYTLTNGPIPDGLLVRHKCDHKPCCNPAHLELGTHADNAADRYERGLGAWIKCPFCGGNRTKWRKCSHCGYGAVSPLWPWMLERALKRIARKL